MSSATSTVEPAKSHASMRHGAKHKRRDNGARASVAAASKTGLLSRAPGRWRLAGGTRAQRKRRRHMRTRAWLQRTSTRTTGWCTGAAPFRRLAPLGECCHATLPPACSDKPFNALRAAVALSIGNVGCVPSATLPRPAIPRRSTTATAQIAETVRTQSSGRTACILRAPANAGSCEARPKQLQRARGARGELQELDTCRRGPLMQ